MTRLELKEDLRSSLYEKIAINEAKKKVNIGAPAKHKVWPGVKRGATVTGEGLKLGIAGARHAATGIGMIAKHIAKGTRPVVRKRPLTSLAVAAGIGALGGYGIAKTMQSKSARPTEHHFRMSHSNYKSSGVDY